MSQTNFGNIAGVSKSESHAGMPSITVERDGLYGEVYIHGAQATSWKPSHQKEDVLFLSPNSHFRQDKAIRGGVPICFPWFGPRPDQPALPQHGFARTREWNLEAITETESAIVVELSYQSDEQSRQLWPFDFVAKHRITFGEKLRLELQIQNSGDKPFRFEEAQHTYFRVGDIRKIAISGLEGTAYLDQPKSGASDGVIRFSEETDRAYIDTDHPLTLTDATLDRRISVVKTNSKSTVVWNPWAQKASALPDLGADQWKQMVCIETCNIRSNAIALLPGESHTMQTEIAIETLNR
jgi:glucose-6-phosphate 1-epimerase